MRRGKAGKRRDTQLSRAEIAVLRLIAGGYTDQQVSAALGIALATARKHRDRVLAKTGSHNRVQAARYAVAHGIVPHEWDGPKTPEGSETPEK